MPTCRSDTASNKNSTRSLESDQKCFCFFCSKKPWPFLLHSERTYVSGRCRFVLLSLQIRVVTAYAPAALSAFEMAPFYLRISPLRLLPSNSWHFGDAEWMRELLRCFHVRFPLCTNKFFMSPTRNNTRSACGALWPLVQKAWGKITELGAAGALWKWCNREQTLVQ